MIKTIVRNSLAFVLGVVGGSIVNMLIVNIGPVIIPLPEGTDVSNMESLQESMKQFTPVHFLSPFLAHALGTLVGAFVAAKVAVSHHVKFALAVGVFFLLGGITMVFMLGGPMWFNVTDVVLAYIPMGLLGAFLAGKTGSQQAAAIEK